MNKKIITMLGMVLISGVAGAAIITLAADLSGRTTLKTDELILTNERWPGHQIVLRASGSPDDTTLIISSSTEAGNQVYLSFKKDGSQRLILGSDPLGVVIENTAAGPSIKLGSSWQDKEMRLSCDDTGPRLDLLDGSSRGYLSACQFRISSSAMIEMNAFGSDAGLKVVGEDKTTHVFPSK